MGIYDDKPEIAPIIDYEDDSGDPDAIKPSDSEAMKMVKLLTKMEKLKKENDELEKTIPSWISYIPNWIQKTLINSYGRAFLVLIFTLLFTRFMFTIWKLVKFI